MSGVFEAWDKLGDNVRTSPYLSTGKANMANLFSFIHTLRSTLTHSFQNTVNL
jgi:hypothetical protein